MTNILSLFNSKLKTSSAPNALTVLLLYVAIKFAGEPFFIRP